MLVITLPSPSLVAFVALDALPDNVATIVDGNFNVTLLSPLTETLAPVLDQFPQRNQYTLVNNEKVSQEKSEVTSKEQNSMYTINTEKIDTTPNTFIDWENNYNFLDDSDSPYSG